MRRLAILLLVAACSNSEQPVTDTAPATPTTTTTTTASATATATTETTSAPAVSSTAPPTQEIERGTFVVSVNGEAIVAEKFARTATRFESEIAGAGKPQRARQVATLRPDGSVSRVDVGIIGGPEDGTLVSLRLEGKNATIERTRGTNTHRETLVVDNLTIPMPLGESIIMLEQVILRARTMGGKSVVVPVITRNLQPNRVTVTFDGNGARVVSPDSTFVARLDANGRLLEGNEPNQKVTITRR